MSTILTIRTGGTSTSPLPRSIMENFESAEITQTDEGPSAFQLTFKVGRNKTTGMEDYQDLVGNQFKLFNTVCIYVKIDGAQHVLMHGVITHQQLNPSSQPGMTTMTITGEDMSVLMDLVEVEAQHPDQDPSTIAQTILADYSQYNVTAEVKKPATAERANKIDFVHTQRSTDREYLKEIAKPFACDFYVTPGPGLDRSTAYWGPKKLQGEMQNAISVNLKQGGNADGVNFTYNGMSPTKMKGQTQTRAEDKKGDVDVQSSSHDTLSQDPGITSQPKVRTSLIDHHTGLNLAQTMAKAQAEVDRSVSDALTVSGDLHGFRYRGVLEARKLVGLRGAGKSFNGKYYVKSVTHKLRRGEYTQSFVLTREGVTSTESRVKK